MSNHESQNTETPSSGLQALLGNKTVVAGALILCGTLGMGSIVGITIEPQETTELRVQNATLKERTTNLEAEVHALRERVELLERIVESCRTMAESCNRSLR